MGIRTTIWTGILVLTLAAGLLSAADDPKPADVLKAMPVREVTVFKDGHTLLLHKGAMPVDETGNVVFDGLISPVMGTFWPFSDEDDAKLVSTVAGQTTTNGTQPAGSVAALIAANVGQPIVIGPRDDRLRGTILSAPQGGLFLLKTDEGIRAIQVAAVQGLVFRNADFCRVEKTTVVHNTLTMGLKWKNEKPKDEARVGMMYVQKGIRWIPSYKVTIDGNGKAVVKLQATLVNELVDLDDVTCNLVIGVPNILFANTPDPIGFQQTVAALSRHFKSDATTGQYFSNAIMTQTRAKQIIRPTEAIAPGAADVELGGSEKNEDLFVFTVKHITLKRGQRMVVPIAEFELTYTDIYTLNVPIAPPLEVFHQFNNQQQAEIARLLAAPKAIHKLRLRNTSKYPITTAPALIFRKGILLGQGMTTYTSIGGTTDLAITTAVDIAVKKKDVETERTPNAVTWNGHRYERVDLAGTITLTNHRKQPVKVEVVRFVLGKVTGADHDGKVEQINMLEDASAISLGEGPSTWWRWYNWPYWSRHLNGLGRASWTVTVEPDKSVDLGYRWSYYWRW